MTEYIAGLDFTSLCPLIIWPFASQPSNMTFEISKSEELLNARSSFGSKSTYTKVLSETCRAGTLLTGILLIKMPKGDRRKHLEDRTS